MEEVARFLTCANFIGSGRSGLVYKVILGSGFTVAVKRFKSEEESSTTTFSSEIATLANIRHRNIIWLILWGANSQTKLLFYNYKSNGTLGELLHEGRGISIEWSTRFKIAIGVAEVLAYLRHDCVPAILHGDMKAHIILLSVEYEACIVDFVLSRLVENDSPQFTESYGYIAHGE